MFWACFKTTTTTKVIFEGLPSPLLQAQGRASSTTLMIVRNFLRKQKPHETITTGIMTAITTTCPRTCGNDHSLLEEDERPTTEEYNG